MNTVPKDVSIEDKGPKKRNRLLRISLAIALCLAIGVLLWWLFGQKSYGSITRVESGIARADEKTVGQSVYEGKYITFEYPSDFNRRTESEAVKHPLLERVYLTQDDIAGRKIAVIVQDNTGYSLEEYSSYRIRATEPAVYQPKTLEMNGIAASVFIKEANGPEVALFFEKNNRVVSVVLSSLTTSEGLEDDARTLLQSFRWLSE